MIKETLKVIGVLVLILFPKVQTVWTVQPVETVQPVGTVETVKTVQTIKALIVTGQNSHDWETSSRVLEQVLEDTGLFDVDLAVSPPLGSSMKNFVPDFSGIQLAVLDYNGDSWSRRAKKVFLDFVRAGGGVVVYHNSGNAFPDWKEYNEVIGLGGGRRDESTGPYAFWQDGKIVLDSGPGRGGYHGYSHDFLVEIYDSTHPIASGLPVRWMHAEDELYSLMRGPSAHLQVLATAYSDPAQKGSGRHEPVLFTNRYGEGRIFHTTLGHASGGSPYPAMECVGFIVSLQRGAEWAATGRVTQEIPGDFPGVSGEFPSPGDVRRWPGYRPPRLENILSELASYEYGQDEQILSRLRDYVLSHKDSPGSRADCEEQLVSFLDSDATLAGIMAVCRHLRLIGTERSVPVLEKLLLQKETSDAARYALEKIPGAEADRALLRCLSKSNQEGKLGIISSLGQRKVKASVPDLGRMLSDPDSSVAAASAVALGHIAGKEAADVLSKSLPEVQGDLQYQVATSLLKCAEEIRSRRDLQEAARFFEKMTGSAFPAPVRQAAVKGLISSQTDSAKSVILDALKSSDTDLHIAAIGMIRENFIGSDILDITALLPSLPEMSQVAVLAVLPFYSPQTVLPSVVEATGDQSPLVRTAALEVLMMLGDESAVPLLAKLAAQTQGRERRVARDALWNLKGPDIDQAIIRHLIQDPDPSIQRELIRTIGERRIANGKHVLYDLARSPDSLTRTYAVRNLERITEPSDLPRLLDLLLLPDQEAEREELRKTIAATAARIPRQNSRADAVREKLVQVKDDRGRCELYRVLGLIGDNSALPLLRQALLKKNSPAYDGAVRALAEWPDSTPRDDLLEISRTAENPSHRVLALRSYIQMTGKERFRAPASVVQSLQDGLEWIERPEEKFMILALLPQFSCKNALKLAQSLLSDEEVRAEAELAVQKIVYDSFKNRFFVFR